ncbi:DUF3089 domain-containing protein [Sphingomonas sp.]|uniref:DUF3089 domain-containing protein n=1 Tax=Sphingomonas sp. TaxID=28214 RepID=UPI00286BD7C0|nr:DUF3089 domain-containing protein [Sphingomonas sp.]
MRILAAGALLAATPLAAQTPARVDYAKDSNWLCLPGRADVCSAPQSTVEVTPAGYGAKTVPTSAKAPPIDCFYVYPTISRDAGLSSDLVMNEEKSVAAAQLARFGSVCRTFAPKYRQMTVGAIVAFSAGQDISAAAALSYGDVAAAFRQFIATRSTNRPFVLIGHSQGSLHLIQLIANEIEKKPDLARRMKLAILPGFNLLVPQGKAVGGSLKKIPICTAAAQLNCVITWTSYREKNPPPLGALFGIADQPGMTVACVNPAAPGAKDLRKLDSVWEARPGYAVAGGPIAWSSEGPAPAPWVRTPGLASGRCIAEGQRGYFSVHTNADPADKRTDRIGGEVSVFGMFIPGWGMHLADMSLVLGDLVRRVGTLSRR